MHNVYGNKDMYIICIFSKSNLFFNRNAAYASEKNVSIVTGISNSAQIIFITTCR